MAKTDAPPGPGPGEGTVPPAGIVFILTLLIVAALANMWTLGTFLDRVPDWRKVNDTLAVRSDSVPVATPPVTGAATDSTRPAAPSTGVTQSQRARQVRDSVLAEQRRLADSDSALLRIVLLAGALGGLLHAIRSFVWYVGNRDLRWSWVPTYLTLPIVGALLAAVTYLVVRAGFVGFTSPTAPSPY